jgi:urease beta subunit
VLTGGASCPIDVSFAPQSTGPITGLLTVDSSGGAQTASLAGRGVSGRLSVAPRQLLFRPRAVGIVSTARWVRVKNSGNQPVEIGAAALVGDRPDAFSVSEDQCSGRQLGRRSTCSIAITFHPRETGSFQAILRIPSTATNGPHLVPLTGTATPERPPVLIFRDDFASGDLSAWSAVARGTTLTLRLAGEPGQAPVSAGVGFGSRSIGAAASAWTIAVVNAGARPLDLGPVDLEMAQAGAFQLHDDLCSGARLEPKAACTLAVSFAPAESGLSSAQIRILDALGTVRGTVLLSGSGLEPEGSQP